MRAFALTPSSAAGVAVIGFLATQAAGIAAGAAGASELAQALLCDLSAVLLLSYGVGLAAYGLHEAGRALLGLSRRQALHTGGLRAVAVSS